MEIGVGRGELTRYLAARGVIVTAVDIADEALRPLEPLVLTYNVAELAEAPPVDIAICHLVLQHCSDAAVEHIFRNVPLVPDTSPRGPGMFSFQFAVHADPSKNSVSVPDESEATLLIYRSLARMEELVERNGLIFTRVSSAIDAGGTRFPGVLWHIVHAVRR
jgi:hypothetical protein